MTRAAQLPATRTGDQRRCALGGAWLTATGYFRRDKRIRLEDAAYADDGSTRIYLALESARIGRLGVAFTAAAIVIPRLLVVNQAIAQY